MQAEAALISPDFRALNHPDSEGGYESSLASFLEVMYEEPVRPQCCYDVFQVAEIHENVARHNQIECSQVTAEVRCKTSGGSDCRAQGDEG